MKRFLLIGALAAMTVSPAAAQEKIKFTSAGGVTGFGYYVGQYQGVLLSEPGQPSIDLYCVDFLHHISLNQVWMANLSSLAGDLSMTRGGATAYALYLRAAWLTQQYSRNATAEWKNIQATIWRLFTSAGPTPTSGDYWLNLANQHYSEVNPKYFYVVTDVDKDRGGTQEFLTYVTPEPGTVALFATGLLLLGVLAMRRRRSFRFERV